jgi:hypothetical protein
VSSPPWRHTHHLVSKSTYEIIWFADWYLGLQTPRLKRLAEIVSTQAMAQEEKQLFDQSNGDEMNGQQFASAEEVLG